MTIWARRLDITKPVVSLPGQGLVTIYPTLEKRSLSTLALGTLFFLEEENGPPSIVQVVGDPAETGPLFVWVREQGTRTFHQLSKAAHVRSTERGWVPVTSLLEGETFSIYVNGDVYEAQLASSELA